MAYNWMKQAINYETLMGLTKRNDEEAGKIFDLLKDQGFNLNKPITEKLYEVARIIGFDSSDLLTEYMRTRDCFEAKLPFGAIIIGREDSRWPKQINDFPYCPRFLYVQGRIQLLQEKSIAVVGTIAPSTWGKEYSVKTAQALGKAGLVVVSGLSLGISSYVLAECVRNFQSTIAVLSTPLGQYAPSSMKQIQSFIAEEGGVVVSRFAPSAPIEKLYQLYRNRLMSALSSGCVIVEDREAGAGVRQAKFAIEHGKKLYLYKKMVDNKDFRWPRVYAKKEETTVVSTPLGLTRAIRGIKIKRKKKKASTYVQLSLFS